MPGSIKMLIVTHKNVQLKTEDSLYIPMLVGSNKDQLHYKVFYRDDDGENISWKNPNYSELTALYWAWKNIDADYIGLVHYRRFFMSPREKDKIISENEIRKILENVDVILPKKRNYYIENTWSHYKHNHNIDDLKMTRNILQKKYPEYLLAFDETMKHKKSHRFNMLIMKKEKLSSYCEWLFEILFELEKRVIINNYDSYQARIFGFISERLLDVWIETNNVNYAELPFKFTEKQNWIKKGSKFLIKKIGLKTKYN